MDGIFDLGFLISDLKAAARQSQIKNLKSKISNPAHPVHPC
jgi:hypothetical protein